MSKVAIATLSLSAAALFTALTAAPSFAATGSVADHPLVIGPQVTITVSCPKDHHAVDHSGQLTCVQDNPRDTLRDTPRNNRRDNQRDNARDNQRDNQSARDNDRVDVRGRVWHKRHHKFAKQAAKTATKPVTTTPTVQPTPTPWSNIGALGGWQQWSSWDRYGWFGSPTCCWHRGYNHNWL
jgi:hypothetical protein